MLFFRTSGIAHRRTIKVLGAVLLLILYVVGNNQLETIHQLLHAHRIVQHSQEQENNPCHQRIFHESNAKGCEHKAHLTDNKDCPLSHVVNHNDQLVTDQKLPAIYPFLTTKTRFVDKSVEFTFLVTLPSRAPPLV
jgi:hypothetical protein